MKLHSNVIGEGKPFIILHGFLGMGDNWKTLGRRFADLGFQIHLVDQRNHGRSPHSDEFSYDLMARDLLGYLDSHLLDNVVLLGHSMGGKTAMTFATLHPERVNKLLVADISPRFYPVHHEAILNGLSSLDFSIIKTRSKADIELSKYVAEIGTRQFLLKNLYWVDKGLLGLRINLPVLKENLEEVGEVLDKTASFSGPTLFLRGDKSEYIQYSDEALIKQHFSNAAIITIADAGHWLHAENPQEFYQAVSQFI